ncbi:MAG: putative bifunctional diguanylate cyclase/phosphodiesterase [Acidimicrobiales bacterium]
MRVAVAITGLVAVVLFAYPLLPGRPSVDWPLYGAAAGAALLGAGAFGLLPWHRLLQSTAGGRCLYAWSFLDIALISVGVAASGGAGSQLFWLYSLTTVFSALSSYPWRAQVVLLLLTYGGYIGAAESGAVSLTVARATFDLGVITLLMVMSAFLSVELSRQARVQHDLAEGSARRAALLARVAQQARVINTLDREQMLDSVVESVGDLGFDTAQLCLYDPEANHWKMVASYGVPTTPGAQALRSGIVGRVWNQRSTVVVQDYPADPDALPAALEAGIRSAMAVPVWCEGSLRAGLVAARTTRAGMRAEEVECVEILAAHAGIALGNVERLDERNRWEAELAYQATHDVLTGLPNWTLFAELQERARAHARRSGRSAAVLLLDLDRFKSVNDSLGHHLGDELLREVAVRLRDAVGNDGAVARYGGDEFVVLVEDLLDDTAAVLMADRLLAALQPPVPVGPNDVYTTGSIGIAFIRKDSSTEHNPLREADLAMYRAKESGKGRWKIFEVGMDARALRLMQIEAQLRKAVPGGEMYLAYQPIVDLVEGRMTGVEALLRWRHPERGLMMPDEFIPVAEESGLIIEIGQWVMEEACQQVQTWNGTGGGLRVSVNLSGRQFHDPSLVSRVRSVLSRTGLDPGRLVLEITETIAMEDLGTTIDMVGDLSDLGVGIALDDFGQGSSSLAALRRFPLESVKIDKVFVSGVTEDGPDRAIVGSVLTLADSLGINVTAEGIETAPQMEALIDMGCPQGQGYLLSRPVSRDEVPGLVAGMRDRLRTVEAE